MEKNLIEQLPSDYKNYFTSILSAYYELKRGDKMGLFTYLTNEISKPILDGSKYERNKKTRLKEFEKLKYGLPENIELNLPRKPLDIKIELEYNLTSKTSEENIYKTLETIFRTGENTREPRKSKKQKLAKEIKSKIKITRKTK